MAELDTGGNERAVDAFLDSIEEEKRAQDTRAVVALMRRVTGEEPKLWSPNIVGFGSYHYRYESGREGDWFLTGVSPRKRNLTVYLISGFDRYGELMAKLGKHKTGKSCLYIQRLEDVDLEVLEQLVRLSVEHMRELYPEA